MIHSLYTEKDIFLRKLISNASDALDKLRFEALTDIALIPSDHKYEIRLKPDLSARTLVISDSGIGMSRQELIDTIGTIARSGTQESRERMKESQATGTSGDLIGQFGVGFLFRLYGIEQGEYRHLPRRTNQLLLGGNPLVKAPSC